MEKWPFDDRIYVSDKTVFSGVYRMIDYRDITDEMINAIAADKKIDDVLVSKELPDEAYQVIDRILEVRPDVEFRICVRPDIKHYDISYLHKLAHLQNLVLEFTLNEDPDLIDFGLLKDLPLKSFGFTSSHLRDLSFVKYLHEDIESIDIFSRTYKHSVRFDCKWLLKFKKLTSLALSGQLGKNVTCLRKMSSLKSLALDGIPLADFSFLKDIGLEKLGLYNYYNEEMSGLGELTSLKEIYLCRINRIRNADFLESLTNLETITLENMKGLTSLPDLSKHSNIKKIVLKYTGIKAERIDERIKPIVEIIELKKPEIKQQKNEIKKKPIYKARITVDDELLANLVPERVGCLESWNLMSQGASYSAYLIVPDLTSTDTFCFDLLFDDNFRKHKDVKIGDHFPISIPSPTLLRQIEIIDIREDEPINNLENKRPVKHKLSDDKSFLEFYLYYYLEIDECHGEDGWFNVEEIIKKFVSIGRLFDKSTLELIVNNDEYHRYIFNEDKTKIRISQEHPAPEKVEKLMKTVDDLNVKRSAFILNILPFIKDKKRSIHVDCSNGDSFDFPYQTNKIFYMDKKHFFIYVIHHDAPMLAVSSYMCKDLNYQYRMAFQGFPNVINNLFPDFAELVDFDGNVYTFTIRKEDT